MKIIFFLFSIMYSQAIFSQSKNEVTGLMLSPRNVSKNILFKSRLKSSTYRNIFPDSTANVVSINVSSGQAVRAGALLIVLKKNDITGIYRDYNIYSPVSGYISDIKVKIGDPVSPSTILMNIADNSSLIIESFISDKDRDKISTNDIVSIKNGSITSTARISKLSLEPNYSNGLYTIEFKLDDTSKFSLGQFIEATIPTDPYRGIVIPLSKIIRRNGVFNVWVITSDSVLELKKVELGAEYGSDVVIKEGLKDKDIIVNTSSGILYEGMPVTITNDPLKEYNDRMAAPSQGGVRPQGARPSGNQRSGG